MTPQAAPDDDVTTTGTGSWPAVGARSAHTAEPGPPTPRELPGRRKAGGYHGREQIRIGRTLELAPVSGPGLAPRRGPTVSTKIAIIYDNPKDPALFESGYAAQLAMVKAINGVQNVESSKVWPKEDGSPTPAYRLLDLYFVDYDSASAAVNTSEAGAFLTHVFDLGTGGVRILFAQVEAS